MTPPGLALALLAASSLLYALLFAIVAGAILRRHSLGDRAGLLLLLYVLLSFLWTLGQLGLRLARVVDRPGVPPGDPWSLDLWSHLLLYALLPLSMLFLALTRRFLQRKGLHWGGWVLGLIWLAAVVSLYENWLAVAGLSWDGPGRLWLGFGLLVLGWGCALVAAGVLTVQTYRRSPQPLHRNRITYWATALVLTTAGGLSFLAGLGAWGSLLHLLGSGTMVYLLMTHRLPDVRRLARGMVRHLSVTLVMAAVYAAAFLVTCYACRAAPLYSIWLVSVTVALILAAVVHPLLDRLHRRLERWVSGDSRDPTHTLGEYGTRISNILDLERLATTAVSLIGQAMNVRRGALFVVHRLPGPDLPVTHHPRDRPGGEFEVRAVAGLDPDQPPVRLSPGSPVVEYLRRQRLPLTQYDVDLLPRFRTAPSGERAWLSGLDMDVYVPICIEGEWIGLLALGPKQSGDRYFDDELSLLRTLAGQTAVAFQNARRFDDLQARTAENERLIGDLRATREELTRLGEGQIDLLQSASHELRRPLDHLRGYVELLHELIRAGALTPERGEEMLEGIGLSLQRLEEMAQALLEASRDEEGPPELDLRRTSLGPVVEAAADHWSLALRERRLALSTRDLQDLPEIMADAERLQQAFVELIQNAIKATPDGGHIQIRGYRPAGHLPVREQTVEIVVADTGLGIARDDLERVFDRFYRVGDVVLDRSGRTKFRAAGPGLGLSRVRAIIQAHGGRIWAISPGHDAERCPGTEMHVRLPLVAK